MSGPGETLMSPETLARWWGMAPLATNQAGETLARCALWGFGASRDTTEVVGQPDPATHIVSLVAQGRVLQEYFANGRTRFRRESRPGLLNVVCAGEQPRALLTGRGAGFAFFHIYLPHAQLRRWAASGGCVGEGDGITLIDPQGAADAGIERTAGALVEELRLGDRLSRLRIDALVQDVGIQLLRRHSNLAGRPAPASKGGLATWQLRRACEAMDASLDQEIGLEELAAVAGCSPTHFSRAFKASTGVTPFTWLLNCRIERAKALLLDRSMPLAEIALAVGFSAQPQFTTAFRRVTGSTPGAWRRERLT